MWLAVQINFQGELPGEWLNVFRCLNEELKDSSGKGLTNDEANAIEGLLHEAILNKRSPQQFLDEIYATEPASTGTADAPPIPDFDPNLPAFQAGQNFFLPNPGDAPPLPRFEEDEVEKRVEKEIEVSTLSFSQMLMRVMPPLTSIRN
eukprot:SAG31_NODE_11319_length_1042_cov_1.516437_1_plen_147_part_10